MLTNKKMGVKGKHTPRMTFDEYLEHIDKVLNILDEEITHAEDDSKINKFHIKNLRSARKSLRKVKNNSYRMVGQKKPRGKGRGGFSKEYSVSKELADFLHVSHYTPVSRIDATRAICVYAHLKPDEDRDDMLKWSYLNVNGKRNLQDPTNKRAIIPDDTLRKLLRYDKFASDVTKGLITRKENNKALGTSVEVPVTDTTLYYWIVQKLVQVHFVK
jgi:chromatin remodeling complex protein RSC6